MSLIALRLTCGAGKTYTAEQIAIERARGGKRTAITSPTHVIAREQVVRLRAAGVPVAYRSAPHKVLDRATGAPICKRLPEAEAIASAGLSVRRELCEGVGSSRCRFRSTCTAAEGLDADEGALVWAGPHQLIAEAVTFAGRNGSLIVDEPPDAVDVSVLTIADLQKAHHGADLFFYPMAWRSALEHTTAAVLNGGSLPAIAADLRERLTNALKQDAPKLSDLGLRAIRSGRSVDVGTTLATVGRALLDRSGRIARTQIAEGRLVVVELALHLRHAIARARHTALIDATLDIEALEALLGHRVVAHDMPAADGAPVERVRVVSASATRRSWLPHGRVETSHLVGPLRRALEVVGEDPTRRTLGIVTFAKLEPAIREAWTGRGPAEIVEVFEPWRRRGGLVETLHFGGVRGRNDFAAVDALVLLGDPWGDKLGAQARAEALGLDFAAAYERAARAELSQAEGRIRAPRRTRAAVVVHVGRIELDGWAGVRAVGLEGGRPRAGVADVRGDVLRAWRLALGLSQAQAAELLGVGERTIRDRERTTGKNC